MQWDLRCQRVEGLQSSLARLHRCTMIGDQKLRYDGSFVQVSPRQSFVQSSSGRKSCQSRACSKDTHTHTYIYIYYIYMYKYIDYIYIFGGTQSQITRGLSVIGRLNMICLSFSAKKTNAARFAPLLFRTLTY